MSKKSVFCIATSRDQANAIVDKLKRSNFSSDDISVLFPDKSTTRDFAHEKSTKAPEGAVTGASTGLFVGGALGWIAGIGALAIPGVGPFIAAGPIIAALSGAAIGGTVGGIAGGLIGLGIPEIEAKRYEGKIKQGNILLSVHTENGDEIKKAKEVFKEADAQDICVTGDASAPKAADAKDSVEPMTSRSYVSTDSVEPPVVPFNADKADGKCLKDLFLDQLADIYDAEHRIVLALPKIAKAATCTRLQAALQKHLQETNAQIASLELVFKSIDKPAKGSKCEATVGLLEESDEMAKEFKGSPAINAALICAVQKVEHYEIASYGCLHEWAAMLGYNEAATLLKDILEQERKTDVELTELARAGNNEEARDGSDVAAA